MLEVHDKYFIKCKPWIQVSLDVTFETQVISSI